MAFYKHASALAHNQHAAFDALYGPGTRATYSGIYRCHGCGREATTEAGNPLPPQNHHQHRNGTPIKWQLIVATDGSAK